VNEARVTHPSPEQLAAFGLGRLGPALQAGVERHVAECDICCRVLRDLPADTLLERLRRGNTTLDTSADNAAARPGGAPPRELADHPRYRIVKVLGSGGMGTVYQAEHRLMERTVALKVINRQLTSHPTAVDRFRREVKAAGRLTHPNIVAAHDAEQAGDLHFLVMEFVEGITLTRLVEKGGPRPVAHACHYARQAALGLQHAFEQGMVHRDVQPQNLMLTPRGQVKILDFGLARLTEEGAPASSRPRITAVDAVVGTVDYMAPEQARDSRRADIRSDVYSLGCTLYYLLTGQTPFPRGTAMHKMLSHIDTVPQPLPELRPEVPPPLVAVVERMMAKDPAQRYQTPAEVAQALAPFCQAAPPGEAGAVAAAALAAGGGGPTTATPPSRPSLLHRHRRTLAVLGMVLLGFLGAWGIYLATRDHATSPGAGAPRQGKVLIVLPGKGYWRNDYRPVREVLEKGGLKVAVASSAKVAQPDPFGGGDPVPVDVLLREVKTADFAAVVFVGADVQDMCHGPAREDARRVIREMMAAGKWVTALCHGEAVLAFAGTLKGKKAARNLNVATKFAPDCGAHWVDEPFVISGRVITGRSPPDAVPFARALLRSLGRPDPSD
jgi:putative intracellular protease/amidase